MDDFHILAFETSSTLCGVALLSRTAGRTRLRTAQHEGRGAHAERILPMAQGLLDQAGLARRDLSAIAFGQGPGGFTGLRVACGVAQGLAVALDVPVLPVDSLCAVALQGAGEDPAGVHVVLQDARMNEVYAAAYRAGGADWVTLQAPALLARADVADWAARESAGWGMRAGAAGRRMAMRSTSFPAWRASSKPWARGARPRRRRARTPRPAPSPGWRSRPGGKGGRWTPPWPRPPTCATRSPTPRSSAPAGWGAIPRWMRRPSPCTT
ncbi:TsaB protein [Castellaniella defragrans 65Phen]|uniref:TsaB protein n=1 Tax=Castellaniella defragrans (strain DSM 12143 / CCUG 39792 / 65Phen) TaxID=1437824 RepID=W8X8R0_CASD6|nr:TsaB protein [Castellaniella defragrans 65Phen]